MKLIDSRKITFLLVTIIMPMALSKSYTRLEYPEVIQILEDYSRKYPESIQLDDASIQYNQLLNERMCGKNLCKHPVVTLTNFKSPSEEISKRPQVLLIGSMHGNEIVGTNTLVRFIQKAAENRYGNFWNLLNTRMIVIVPMANPHGFYNVKRVKRIDNQ